jgi:thymidine phosphorylase
VIGDAIAADSGFVTAIDGRALGQAVVHLGGGRLKEGDPLDYAVGLSNIVRLGQRIEAGAPLAQVHAGDEFKAEIAAKAVRAAVTIEAQQAEVPQLIRERVA